MATRPWADLPCELLSMIADRLGLIELLRFRSVCKDWHCASSTASAQPESLTSEPWFLVYGEGSQCSLLSNSVQKYSINIPEMDGATCLASNGGWLLLYRNGSIFFFCPFSRAKIQLPNCPFAEEQLKKHIAAFSSAPTCRDCMVIVIKRVDDLKLELDLLHRGKKEWTKHNYLCPLSMLNTITGAVYHDGLFQFLDDVDDLVTFDPKNNEWADFSILPAEGSLSETDQTMTFHLSGDEFLNKDMKAKLGFEDNVSISTCGMLIAYYRKADALISNENIPAAAEGCERRHLEGVWIQPRYFQISPEYSWLFADGGV